jgi:glutaredoxin
MTTQVVTNWKKEWFEIEDATYLNTAAHTVMPRVSIRAVEHALEAKKFPHRVDESVWFEAPVRIQDLSALADLKKLGYMTIPVIVIDGSVIVGFDAAKIDQALGG